MGVFFNLNLQHMKILTILFTLFAAHLYAQISPKTADISEVLIDKKIHFERKLLSGQERRGNIGLSTVLQKEICVFMENPETQIGKVKTVMVDLKKREGTKLASYFSVHFYRYDMKNDRPGERLNQTDIVVKTKNEKYRLKIDVKNYNIIIPTDGICVSVEMIAPANTPKNSKLGPALRYTLSNSRTPKMWINYKNRGWEKSYFKAPNFKTDSNEYSNPMITMEILYPKNPKKSN